MVEGIPFGGTCDPRFNRLREEFERNFRERNEVGAALSVVVDGRAVVDLWGGFADQARTAPWQRDTLVNVYSTTKGMVALLAHQLIDEGRLDLDAPVARYWPEFAQAGKGALPVRWLLCHKAGLAALRGVLPGEALYDFDAMTTALAAEEPWWTPGEKHGYHAVTFGWLVGELVRRVTGIGVGAAFRERVAGPLGADFHIGLPDAEHARVAEMSGLAMEKPEGLDEPSLAAIIMADPEGMVAKAFANPPSMILGPNNPEWRRAEIPGANGQANARAIARIYGVLANGGHDNGTCILSAAGVARCREPQAEGPDLVLQISTRFGLGYMLPQARRDFRFGPSEEAFGHPGAGGSLGCADPENRVGFGYVMNRMGPHLALDPRCVALLETTYECLGR